MLPAGVLLAAIGLQGINVFRQVHESVPPHLEKAIPRDIVGWTSQDVPLGANEYLSDNVEKVLNYDEVIYRRYSHAGESFEVYAAYWGAGKMPTRLVASHTPDRCWTENGWQCIEMRFKQPEAAGGVALKPAEWRKFLPPTGGEPTYVLYWHLVDGHLYNYGGRFNAVPDPVLWWKDAFQQALLGSREQYFIRINSPEPIESLKDDPGFRQIVDSLARLGLQASPSS